MRELNRIPKRDFRLVAARTLKYYISRFIFDLKKLISLFEFIQYGINEIIHFYNLIRLWLFFINTGGKEQSYKKGKLQFLFSTQ